MTGTFLEGPNGTYYILLDDGRLLSAATFSVVGDDVPIQVYLVSECDR